MPPQQRWHTPAPWPAKLSEPPCLGALLKWCSKCPAAIKNGQSPLMPVQASLKTIVEPWEWISTPCLSAISKSETMSCMHSSNASGFSEYVSLRAATDSQRVVSLKQTGMGVGISIFWTRSAGDLSSSKRRASQSSGAVDGPQSQKNWEGLQKLGAKNWKPKANCVVGQVQLLGNLLQFLRLLYAFTRALSQNFLPLEQHQRKFLLTWC